MTTCRSTWSTSPAAARVTCPTASGAGTSPTSGLPAPGYADAVQDTLGWIVQRAPGARLLVVGPDGEHPNRAGEDFLAAKFVALLEPLAP